MVAAETAALGVMAACLIFFALALAAVSIALVALIWKRLPISDHVAAQDMAQQLTAAWDAGARTRKNLDLEASENALLEIETRRRRQQWRPDPHEPQPGTGGPQRESVELGTFGETPMMPEMAKLL